MFGRRFYILLLAVGKPSYCPKPDEGIDVESVLIGQSAKSPLHTTTATERNN